MLNDVDRERLLSPLIALSDEARRRSLEALLRSPETSSLAFALILEALASVFVTSNEPKQKAEALTRAISYLAEFTFMILNMSMDVQIMLETMYGEILNLQDGRSTYLFRPRRGERGRKKQPVQAEVVYACAAVAVDQLVNDGFSEDAAARQVVSVMRASSLPIPGQVRAAETSEHTSLLNWRARLRASRHGVARDTYDRHKRFLEALPPEERASFQIKMLRALTGVKVR